MNQKLLSRVVCSIQFEQRIRQRTGWDESSLSTIRALTTNTSEDATHTYNLRIQRSPAHTQMKTAVALWCANMNWQTREGPGRCWLGTLQTPTSRSQFVSEILHGSQTDLQIARRKSNQKQQLLASAGSKASSYVLNWSYTQWKKVTSTMPLRRGSRWTYTDNDTHDEMEQVHVTFFKAENERVQSLLFHFFSDRVIQSFQKLALGPHTESCPKHDIANISLCHQHTPEISVAVVIHGAIIGYVFIVLLDQRKTRTAPDALQDLKCREILCTSLISKSSPSLTVQFHDHSSDWAAWKGICTTTLPRPSHLCVLIHRVFVLSLGLINIIN